MVDIFRTQEKKVDQNEASILLSEWRHFAARKAQATREIWTSGYGQVFTSSELMIRNFHDSMILGKGGYGTVYKGPCRITKSLQSRNLSKLIPIPSQIEQFINEVIILARIRHMNVVRLLGCCLESRNSSTITLLVYEFINNGTQNIHIKEKGRSLNWAARLKIAAEIAGALSYLHCAATTPIIHRDVKSANILLDTTFTGKVSDFGASRLVPFDQKKISTMVQGTLGYLDPEYMHTNQLTEKSVVYSFDVVLLELLTGRRAFRSDDLEEEIHLASYFLHVLREDRLFQVVGESIVSEENQKQITEAMLAQTCLSVKGEDRPCMKEIARVLDGLRYRTIQESISFSAERFSGITLDISSYRSMTCEDDDITSFITSSLNSGNGR